MQAKEGRPGRVFVIRLEHGDKLPDTIENFAAEKGIKAGYAILVGESGKDRLSWDRVIHLQSSPNHCFCP